MMLEKYHFPQADISLLEEGHYRQQLWYYNPKALSSITQHKD